MQEQAVLLKELQETDSIIRKLEKEHEAVLTASDIRRSLEDVHILQRNMGKLEKDCEKLSMQYKREEIMLVSLQEQKQQAEKNLYGGTVCSNKEMMHIQEKIQHLQDQINKQENSMMGIMEMQETAEQKNAKLNAGCMQMQHELKMKQRENADHILRVTTQVKELMLRKNNLRERISKDILTVYDELTRRKGTAVAWLQGNLCTGCRVTVPDYIIDGVREAEKLIYCETCGRLLIPSESA